MAHPRTARTPGPEDAARLPELVLPIDERDHCLHARDAKYSLVEYGDYECPNCLDGVEAVHELLRDLGDDLCYVFRNFPQSDIHPNAVGAAEAAEAADMQAKFWLMHDRLFEHQTELSPALYQRLARELPVDLVVFNRDLRSGAAARRVAEDVEGARRAGVAATPTFFANGRLVTGRYDFDALRAALVG
ncbi:MAG TPA: thioredoxin domain-containing protein [Thermoplasmata archaeon]|nr:thioredoxin domain-containing protein [Thermoplasmata archaeon]